MTEHSEAAATTPGTSRRLRREAILFAVMLAIGLLLPVAIYFTGQLLLGDYSDDGAGVGHLYGDVFADLAAGSPFAWGLILGPWLGIQLVRLLWWPLSRRTRSAGAPG